VPVPPVVPVLAAGVVVQRYPGEAPGSHEDASLLLYARR
jgi:hypothetical protein